MSTKREAALVALGLARNIHEAMRGDDDADEWVLRLLWLADDLDPNVQQHPWYEKLLFAEGSSRQTKLRALIEHPATPSAERETAVAMLDRLRRAS